MLLNIEHRTMPNNALTHAADSFDMLFELIRKYKQLIENCQNVAASRYYANGAFKLAFD